MDQNVNLVAEAGDDNCVKDMNDTNKLRSGSNDSSIEIVQKEARHENGQSNINAQAETEKTAKSEYVSLAADMRSKIESKINEIEKTLNIPSEDLADSEASEYIIESPVITRELQTFDSSRDRSSSMYEKQQSTIFSLKDNLDKAHKSLRLKEEEVTELSKLRDQVGSEIEDLTATLFEEANKLVHEAYTDRARAEKSAKEANMKLSIIEDQLQYLKAKFAVYVEALDDKVRLSISDQKLLSSVDPSSPSTKDKYEVDPVFHSEFVEWRKNPRILKDDPFMERIYKEDIKPCMLFKNKQLAEEVLTAIENDTIAIEQLPSNVKRPKYCALLDISRFCYYKMCLDDSKKEYFISKLSRDRVTAICELFCYLRYNEKGLINKSMREVYLEILKKREKITSAKLGLFS